MEIIVIRIPQHDQPRDNMYNRHDARVLSKIPCLVAFEEAVGFDFGGWAAREFFVEGDYALHAGCVGRGADSLGGRERCLVLDSRWRWRCSGSRFVRCVSLILCVISLLLGVLTEGAEDSPAYGHWSGVQVARNRFGTYGRRGNLVMGQLVVSVVQGFVDLPWEE